MMHKQTWLRVLLAAILVSFLSSGSYADVDDVLLGDINLDGVVNVDDVEPFVLILMTADFQEEADIDRNGIVNQSDTIPFLEILLGRPFLARSYARIRANAPAASRLITDNEYLAEYLRQNPNVAYWEQGTDIIRGNEGPQDSDYTEIVSISPSGGDDTEAFVNALDDLAEGGALDGANQIFQVNGANLTAAISTGKAIRNMRIRPEAGGIIFTVSGPDVSFLNVHIQGQNRSIQHVWFVNASADRFTLVNSSVQDVLFTGSVTASMVRIRNGADDVYIVNNIFRNLIADNPAPARARMRAVLISGPPVDGQNSRGGITASNIFRELQSNGQGDDADAFVVQGFTDGVTTTNTFDPNNRHLFMANRGIDCGKRLCKAQTGGVDVHSNFNHWKTPTGPVGTRVTRDHFAFLGGSFHRITNNHAISDFVNPNSESFFVQFQTHRLVGDSFDSTNIQVNFNRYTHNSSTDNGESSYAFEVYDFAYNGQVAWPSNSEITNNRVDGRGQLRFHYWFRINDLGNDPGDPTGPSIRPRKQHD